MRHIRFTTFLFSLLLGCISFAPSIAIASEKYEYTFFEGTQYPLTVTFLRGELKGPTVLVQGGIQGDEPSGYISAQLLTKATVKQGNLIIVPRANIPSINLQARQVNVDMNRRFDQEYNRFYEDRLARVVRFLLAQSDVLIHLHEGSGFYNPTYIDETRNPQRYGQSIIVDTLRYGNFSLGQTVNTALEELNAGIQSEKYKFKLFNTQTFDANSDYKEMRKSLTCYALTARGIPAMAVEVSKYISQLDWKVRHQMDATRILLKHYGVLLELPEITNKAINSYAEKNIKVRVNGRPLRQNQVLDLVPGVPLAAVTEKNEKNEFNPSLALFASDRPGVNLLAAPRMILENFNSLELRSDGKSILNARVRIHDKTQRLPAGDCPIFLCWLNGQPIFIQEGQSLETLEGDQLIIEGILGSSRDETLNFKGYVAKPCSNDGQDIGWEIILDPENFMEKYQLKNTGENSSQVTRFEVVRETPKTKHARFFINIRSRYVQALRLKNVHGQNLIIPWVASSRYHLPSGEYILEDAWSNGSSSKLIPTVNDIPLRKGEAFSLSEDASVQFSMYQATTFAPLGSMVLHSGTLAHR